MKYATGFENEVDTIIENVERKLIGEVIKSSNPDCTTAQRRLFIRRLQDESSNGISGIAGLSSKPADTIMDGKSLLVCHD